jgi:hypothetical protein
MNTRLVVWSRQTWLIQVTTLICVIALPALVYAHGTMGGPDELGPPLGTAGLIGFVSYWVVMWWPSGEKKADSQGTNNAGNSTVAPQLRPRGRKRPRVKRVPHLRKIEAGGQFSSDQTVRRKASDG